MPQLICYYCPQCGKKHDDSGRLGSSRQCDCGFQISRTQLDKVRHYWIFQASIAFGSAAFVFGCALFYQELPKDSFERLLSPLLQVPNLITILVSYWLLVRQKRVSDDSYLILNYFLMGIVLLVLGILSVLLIAIFGGMAL